MPRRELRDHQQGPPHVTFAAASIGALLRQTAARAPEKDFVIIAESGARMTYGGLMASVYRGARGLRSRGLQPGDKVALLLRNTEQFVWLYFSTLALGCVVVPINPDLSDREITYILSDSGAQVVFVDARLKTVLDGLAGIEPPPFGIHEVGTLAELEHAVGEDAAGTEDVDALINAVEPTDIAVILYTSGTTGRPKGVVLNHLNFVADATAIANWFCFDDRVRTLCILPLFHNNGEVVTLLAPLVAGGSTVITDPRASLRSFWSLVTRFDISWTSAVPSILATVRACARPPSTPHRMEGIICGGQVLSRELQLGFEADFGVPVFEGFGLTETTSFSCFNDYPAAKRRPGSIGRALPVNVMEIFDEHGQPAGPGVEGEIRIRGYNVATEYYRLDALNAERFRDGWFHTGDYGCRDEDGYFRFLGRRDDLIIKGGENIYPAELENVLFMHPDVSEVAVIGIPDDLLGQDLCAFVKLKEHAASSEEALTRFCHDKIASFKWPRRVLILNELPDLKDIPKGPTNKVLYRQLSRYFVERVC